MSYQKTTGPLMANSHPGSYCGQDAYNDMFVTARAAKRERERERVWTIGNGQIHQMDLYPVANALNCMHDQQIVLIVRKRFMNAED